MNYSSEEKIAVHLKVPKSVYQKYKAALLATSRRTVTADLLLRMLTVIKEADEKKEGAE